MWERTRAARHPSLETARQEARARQNEARYLTELTESGDDLFAEPDG